MSTDIDTPEGASSLWRRVAGSGEGGKVLAVLFLVGAAMSLVGLADMADVGVAGSAIALAPLPFRQLFSTSWPASRFRRER